METEHKTNIESIESPYMEEMGVKTQREGYEIEIKYSPEAYKDKLMRFTTPSGDQFVISADEMINMLVEHVNLDVLAPTFVDTKRVNVVNVKRSLMVKAQVDIKAGTEFAVGYVHPYPVEFAILEEAYKIAKIIPEMGVTELTKEFIDDVKAKIQPNMKEFTKQFYKSFKNVETTEKNDETSEPGSDS